jgi:hypothetical protein
MRRPLPLVESVYRRQAMIHCRIDEPISAPVREGAGRAEKSLLNFAEMRAWQPHEQRRGHGKTKCSEMSKDDHHQTSCAKWLEERWHSLFSKEHDCRTKNQHAHWR